MAFDYKKEYKEFYMPKGTPSIVTVSKMNYIAVRGNGNPNDEDGEYKHAIGLLYGIAFTIKMSKKGDHTERYCRNGEEIGDTYTCTYGCPVNKDGYGICSKTMMMLYPLMEAVRSGGDLENLGGDSKYTKTVVCPDGCVMFRLTAKPLGNENFHKGGYWKDPEEE